MVFRPFVDAKKKKNSYSSWPLLKILSVGQILNSTLPLLVSPTRCEEGLR